MKNYDINELLENINFNDYSFNDYGNGVLLTNYETQVLDKYKINYKNCQSLKELLYEIEDNLKDYIEDDLEQIAISISDRDYYQNTNK